MTTIKTSLLGFILPFVLVACAGPKLTNNDRGKYRVVDLKNHEKVLTVSVSALPLPPPPEQVAEKPKTFFDLRDSIPHTLLRQIGKDPTKYKLFVEAIKASLSDVVVPVKAAPAKEIDNNVIKIRFNFSTIQSFFNDANLLHANTKLEYLNTTLEVEPTEAYVYTIDRLENEFEQIDMGTLERSQDVKFNTNLTGEASNELGGESTSSSGDNNTTTSGNEDGGDAFDEKGNKVSSSKKTAGSTNVSTNSSTNKATVSQKAGAKAELQYANTETIKEALALKFKKMRTSFSFSPTKITVSQRGRPMLGISDNVFVTATLKIPNLAQKLDTKDVTKFENLIDDNGKLQPIDKIKRTVFAVHYAPCHSASDISLKVGYEGAIRAADNLVRGRNVLEFDDKVTYYRFKGDSPASTIRIQKSDICRDVFRVIAKTSDGASYILNTGSGTPTEVLLYSEHDPASFVKWLEEVVLSGDKNRLQSNKGDLTFIDRKDVSNRISVSKSVLTATEIKKLMTITGIGAEIKKQ